MVPSTGVNQMAISHKSKAALRVETPKLVSDFVSKGGKVTQLPTGRKVADTGASMKPASIAAPSRGESKIEYLPGDISARATFKVVAECSRELPENLVTIRSRSGKDKVVSRPRTHTCVLDFSNVREPKHWIRIALSNGVIVKVQSILRNHTLAEMESGQGLAGLNLHHFDVASIMPLEGRASSFGGGRVAMTEVQKVTKAIADSKALGGTFDPRQEKKVLADAAKRDAANAAAKAALTPTSPDAPAQPAERAAKAKKK
jgi:hypothetical protein